MTPKALLVSWREDAEKLEQYGQETLAKACRRHADELEAALRSAADEALSLAQAARESGYSPDRLRHLVTEGKIPNAGRKGSPRIKRGDLPSKGNVKRGRYDATAAACAVLRDQ